MAGREHLKILVSLVLVLVSVTGGVLPARALEWGLITPGRTTMDDVRAHYGEATRAVTQKVDGYDTTQWIYEGGKAPVGIERMIVDFGILTPQGYRPQIVRSLLLHPRHGVFNRDLVVQGWGPPTGKGEQSGFPAYFYEDGLFVSFDKEAWEVKSMLFTTKQKIPAPQSAPPR